MSDKEYRNNLVELSNSGYEIVADEPDIRKWKVRNGDGKILGVVDDLILDKQLRKVRYIVLDLEGKPLNLLSRKVLIPIGISRFDDVDDVVILPNITIEHLATLPAYNKGKIRIDEERRIRNRFSAPDARVSYDDRIEDDHFYDNSQFDDTNYYNSRRKYKNQE
jgi:sporulation protein YlmC with PRC-barrel domain